MLNVEKLERPQADLAYEINDATGFADGSTFDSPEDVREYFNVETLKRLMDMSQCSTDAFEEEYFSQETLDEWADFVIEHRLHCDF